MSVATIRSCERQGVACRWSGGPAGYAPEAMPLAREAARQVLRRGRRAQEHSLGAKTVLHRVQPPHRRPRAPRHLSGFPASDDPPVPTVRRSYRRSSPMICTPEYLSTNVRALELDLEPWPRAASPRSHRLMPGRTWAQRHCARYRLRRSRLRHRRDDVGRGVPRSRTSTVSNERRICSPFHCRAGQRPSREPMADGTRLDRARRRSATAAAGSAPRSILGGVRSLLWLVRTPRSVGRSSPPASAVCSMPLLALVGLRSQVTYERPGRDRARDARALGAPVIGSEVPS